MEALKTNLFLAIFLASVFLTITLNEVEGRSEPKYCWMPKDPGPCRALIPRWYFNNKTLRCEMFNYGGCQGNGNNYKSRGQCEVKCHKITAWGTG
ncbi:Kunitz/BPTI-like toxin [Orchesella cincta]|uniref:Kunitz/BPTI-like toxin n=1 Tax=Orchesella cincta TaxID=48709 RepID=A0A1D2N7Y4_ORCCI|nr:Kunitz/BPTI-like toxin [Orchesella cincta]